MTPSSHLFVQDHSMEAYLHTISTTIQGARYSPAVQPKTHRATASVIESRKTWKSLKASKEYVWPPHIERALIEGLEKYRPTTSTNPKALKRFPKRNRWIADHILQKTGASRTAKQVGSRLQQLRDTCQDDRIKTLLSRREYSPDAEFMPSPSPEKGTLSSSSRVSSPCSATLAWEPSSFPHKFATKVKVEALTDHHKERKGALHSPTRTWVTIEVQSSDNEETDTHGISHLPIINTDSCEVVIYASQPLKKIAPIISFTTSTFISIRNYHSSFRVFHGNEPLYSESTGISLESSSSMSSKAGMGTVSYMHVYRSEFIPRFWDNLGKTIDIFQCMILHEIVGKSSHTDQSDDGTGIADVLSTVVYQFRPAPAPSTPCPSRDPLEHAGTSIALDSLLEGTQVAAQPSAEASFTASLANASTASLKGSKYVHVPETMTSVEGDQLSCLGLGYVAYPGDISAGRSTSLSASTQESTALSSQQSSVELPDGYQIIAQDLAFQFDENHDGKTYFSNGAVRIPVFQATPRSIDALDLPVYDKQLRANIFPQDDGVGGGLGGLPTNDPNYAYFWEDADSSYSSGGVIHGSQYDSELRSYQSRAGHCGTYDVSRSYDEQGRYEDNNAPSNDAATFPFDQFASAEGLPLDYSSSQAQMP